MKNVISIVVNGVPIGNVWTDVRVKRSLTSLCSSYEFTSTQDQPFDFDRWPIKMGHKCEVYVDGSPVLRGWIEDINADYGNNAHTVQVAGRDYTGDLVDCQMETWQTEYLSQTVLGIIKTLCRPFKEITVSIDKGAKQKVSRTLQSAAQAAVQSAISSAVNQYKEIYYVSPGDNIAGAIVKIARWGRVYTLAGTNGDLLLTLCGGHEAVEALVRGKNVIRGGLKCSNKERFSIYRVKGIGIDGGIDSMAWMSTNGPVKDKDIRYRPYASLSPTTINSETVVRASQAEMQYRVGSSRTYTYTVQGWRQTRPDGTTGDLWAPNLIAYVTDPLFNLKAEPLLIESVDYMMTDQGTITQMTLCPKMKYAAKIELDVAKTIFDIGYH